MAWDAPNSILINEITIINCGDTFQTRGIIETECLRTLEDYYSEWLYKDIPQIMLVGNHDQQDRDGKIHPMSIFQLDEDWLSIDEPTEIDNVWYFPYMKADAIKWWLVEYEEKSYEGKIAFVHWGIRGAMMNDWRKDDEGVPAEWLKPFKKVFSGHYHYRNSFENVQYIGSPMQQNFAEMGQDKGVMIVDLETAEHTFVPIEGTRKHHRLELTWSEKGRKVITGDRKVIKENDVVEYVITGDADRVAKIKKEELQKIVTSHSIKVTRRPKEKHVSRLNLDTKEIYDPKSIMSKYVDFVETDLDKKRLMDVGLKVYGGIL